MPIYLRQSTASQEVPLGYFVDATDGNTEETALTINNTDIKVWKTGATTLANKNSGGGTHISNGLYYAVLDATDTDVIGPLLLFVHVAGALAVRVECCVLDEAVYDALFGTVALATATNITSASGVALAASQHVIVDSGTVTTLTNLPATAATAAELAKVPKSDGTLTFNVTCSSDIKSGLATQAEVAKVPKSDGTTSWNATALAAIQSECNDALTAYDPPTKAELDTAQGAVTLANGPHGGAAATLALGGAGGLTGAVTGNITGNLSGSVGSVTGAVGSVTGAVGSVTGAVGSVTAGVTLANGAHGGAAATLALKSVTVTNSDGGGTAVGIVANGAGGTGVLVSGDAADITADLNGTVRMADGGIQALSFAAGAINAPAIAADAIGASELAADAGTELATALLDLANGVETGLTLRQALRLIAAANAGKLSGSGTGTVTIRNAVADSKNRITATIDGNKDRTAIVTDLS